MELNGIMDLLPELPQSPPPTPLEEEEDMASSICTALCIVTEADTAALLAKLPDLPEFHELPELPQTPPPTPFDEEEEIISSMYADLGIAAAAEQCRATVCPVPGCGKSVLRLWNHLFKYHKKQGKYTGA